jgi:hypothetical protein
MFFEFCRHAASIVLMTILPLFLIGCGSAGSSASGGDSGGFTVTGKISLADGTPVSGALVKLYKTSYTIYSIDTVDRKIYSTRDATGAESVSLDSVIQSATTDVHGIYSFSGVFGGIYTIQPTPVPYVFKWSLVPTRSNIGVMTITGSGTVYIYNPEGIGNKLSDDGTIIYNTGTPFSITNNMLDGQDFEASLPGGSGL